ncbi:hypothetical protein ACFS07_10605 [Undibacterium arcticum]
MAQCRAIADTHAAKLRLAFSLKWHTEEKKVPDAGRNPPETATLGLDLSTLDAHQLKLAQFQSACG